MQEVKQFVAKHFFALLVGITVFFVLAALIIANEKTYYGEEEVADKPFLSELEGRMHEIASIAIYQKGEVFKASSNSEGEWVLESKNNYPVDIQKIRKVVLDAAALKVVEKKTSNPEHFIVLEVEDPKDSLNEGIRMVFYDAQGEAIVDFIVGKSRRTQTNVNANHIYVRRMNENQVWLVSGAISVDLSAKSLLGSEVFSVDATRIKSMARKFLTDAKDYTFERTGLGSPFNLKKPKGYPFNTDRSGIMHLNQALEEIDFESVQAKENVPFVRKETITTIYKTFDGLTLTVKAFKKGDRVWIHLKADGKEGDAKEEAERINELTEAWAYAVTKDIGQALTATLKELAKMGTEE